jgi:glycogen(starch) synthase
MRLAKRAFAVTGVSESVCAGARRDLGDCAANVRLIVNALPPSPPAAPYPRNGRILALGRLVPEKGFDTLVEAFALVRRSRSEATLTIAGEGPELGALQARAAELQLGDAISFPGWIAPDAVHRSMEGAAIIAFPSRCEEPFGLVALEAAQAARPCVVTGVGELPSIVRDGETGLVVPRDEPRAMASALLRLLDNPDEAAKLGARASSWVDAQYNFDAMVAAYVRLFGQAREARG